MPIPVACPSCGRNYTLDANYCEMHAGKLMGCGCGARIPIPRYSAEAAAEAARVQQLDGVWRDGPHLVMSRGARLPCRCHRCGVAIDRLRQRDTLRLQADKFGPGRLGRTLSELNAVEITVRYGECAEDAPRLQRRTLGWCLIAAAVALFVAILAGVFGRTIGLVGIAVVGLLALAGFIVADWPSPFQFVQWQGNRAWISGFGEEYLGALPPLESEADAAASNLAVMTDTGDQC